MKSSYFSCFKLDVNEKLYFHIERTIRFPYSTLTPMIIEQFSEFYNHTTLKCRPKITLNWIFITTVKVIWNHQLPPPLKSRADTLFTALYTRSCTSLILLFISGENGSKFKTRLFLLQFKLYYTHFQQSFSKTYL